jgi:putative transposase
MKRSKFTEEQVAYVLQAESGTAVEDICLSIDISQATFYIWKKKYGQLGASEVRRLRQLEEENFRLKRLVADLTLDKSILQEAIKKRSKTFVPTHVSAMDSTEVWSGNRACVQLSETF